MSNLSKFTDRKVNLTTEYLYTVKVRKTGELKQVRARGIKGVAVELKLNLDDIVYVTKVKL